MKNLLTIIAATVLHTRLTGLEFQLREAIANAKSEYAKSCAATEYNCFTQALNNTL